MAETPSIIRRPLTAGDICKGSMQRGEQCCSRGWLLRAANGLSDLRESSPAWSSESVGRHADLTNRLEAAVGTELVVLWNDDPARPESEIASVLNELVPEGFPFPAPSPSHTTTEESSNGA